jgi:DNA repair exonuclease SbcCD nuclease subunit
MAVRILHTADWQLGKPFNNIPGDAGALLREARFDAVRSIARHAQDREVDAVLVAGDVFDSNLVSEQTLLRALAAMSAFNGLWILLPGNHDPALSASVWSRLQAQGLPENVRLALEPKPIVTRHDRLAILPAPLTERRTLDDLTAWMDDAQTPQGALRIGLAHGAVTGRLPEAADAQNPIAEDRALRARLDHLALGDWHGCLEIAPRTWYAGTPEPDRHRANAAGHALLVEIDEAGAPPRVERLETGRYAWRTLALDCTADGAAELLAAHLRGLERLERTVFGLKLSGTVSLAARELLETAIERARAACHHLELDDAGLQIEPDEGDLLELDSHPVIGCVAARLRERFAEGDAEARAAAAVAVRLLWQEVRRVGAPR